MNKKADFVIGGEFWTLVVHLFFLIIVAISIFTIISLAVSKKFDITGVEEQVIFNSIYMNECINHRDLRIYPGVIDLNKFRGNLDECFKSKNFGSKIILSYEDKKIENFIDKKFFHVESRFCPFEQYKCSNFNIPVIVKDNDVFKRGELVVEAVLKNV